MKQGMQTRPLETIAFTAYVLAVFYIVPHHILFVDETDPWVFAREATWQQAKLYFAESGHPPLWHALLFPFARLGLPVETMQYITACLAAIFAFVLLFVARLPIWLKLAVLLTFSVGYQYPIVSRGYMLMLVLMTTIAVLYPKRKQYPLRYFLLLGLLCNTESYAIVMAAALALQFGLELVFANGPNRKSIAHFFRQKRLLLGVLICLSLFLLCLTALWPTENTRHQYNDETVSIYHLQQSLAQGFFPVAYHSTIEKKLFDNANPMHHLLSLFGALILALTMWCLSNWKLRLVFAATLLWPMFIFTFIYGGSVWHYMLYPLICLIFLWMDRALDQSIWRTSKVYVLALLLAIIWLVNINKTISAYQYELNNKLDVGKNIASYIQKNGLQDKPFILYLCRWRSNVTAYLPETPFWQDHIHQDYNFTSWVKATDLCYQDQQYETKLKLAMQEMQTKTLHAISSEPIAAYDGYSMTLLQIFDASLHGEQKLYLYKISQMPNN